MVQYDDVVHEVQPEAGSLAWCFRCVERFENTALDLGRYPRAGVANSHFDLIAAAGGRPSQGAPSPPRPRGAVDEIRPPLVLLAPVGFVHRKVSVVLSMDLDSRLEPLPEDIQGILQPGVDLHLLQRRLIEIGVGLYGPNDFRYAGCAHADLLHQTPDGQAIRQPAQA